MLRLNYILSKYRKLYAVRGDGCFSYFAVAAIALTKVAMQYTQSTSNAILRTKAQFVAMNEIATMEINQEWLEGTQSKQVTAQGETWQIDKKHNQH